MFWIQKSTKKRIDVRRLASGMETDRLTSTRLIETSLLLHRFSFYRANSDRFVNCAHPKLPKQLVRQATCCKRHPNFEMLGSG